MANESSNLSQSARPVADLPPTAKMALNVLDRDGYATQQDLIVRLRPAYPEAVRSVIRQLAEDGYIVITEGMIRRAR